MTVAVVANGIDVTWTRANGTALKSAPASVKVSHGPEVKAITTAVKDAQRMLATQRQRFDAMFVSERNRPWAEFRRRYLEQPLLAALATRLIWRIGKTAVLVVKGEPQTNTGQAVVPSDDAEVSLWHPMHSVDEVAQWRKRLIDLQLTQPFKQAHREVYVLADAERASVHYSNRFAGHIIRQSQFRALAGHRGWSTRLIGPWDGGDSTKTTRPLANGIRAEFWLGAANTDDANSVGETGWHYLSTDQVRFYRGDTTDPLPLDQVPPLVFSEIMRDVDLFVSVASVGNDSTWQDGGPNGRYRDYWQSYSFGELSQTAQTRRAVLESLLPRLTKIRERCSLAERFLLVRGELRSYKIHLGSGNILMEPKDEYLCIVPAQSAGRDPDVFLPFEGDATLSIILSKAFMLAEDTRIKDSTIMRQIKRG